VAADPLQRRSGDNRADGLGKVDVEHVLAPDLRAFTETSARVSPPRPTRRRPTRGLGARAPAAPR
jgi:hypothetical protein